MTKSKFMRIVLIATSVLILIGVALMAWMLATQDERNYIKVDLDEDVEPIVFEDLCLIPGQQSVYILRLNSGSARSCNLSLDFVELEEKNLKDFAYIRIESNGQVLYDQRMCTAFEDGDISLPVDFTDTSAAEFTITYYLPIEVGNEAQNAEAFFELLITASNE